MTSLRNRIIFSCLSIAGTAGLVAFSNPVSAAPVEGARQASVATADLDLAAPAGRAAFERRAAAAASQVCAQPTRTVESDERACRLAVMAQARRGAGIGDVAID